ncbi:cytochrome c biogenesis protein CcsA [Pedobacter agri]|uniref:cytochrome c biogenesis protein CcsA n=1 Tax=Pedobacter agri TaxID=454586 RepID=UPI00292CF20A|nr:cytochrome c biogenesis protein CcsA [Pedobacter agri]
MDKFIYQQWWKVLGCLLILYSVIAGILLPVPHMPILHETIRVVFFHVPMWIGMFVLFLLSVIFSILYLWTNKIKYDLFAVECVNVGLVFFIFGLLSGMAWAQMAWGQAWSNDPKQTMSVIAFLLYTAYIILRSAMDEQQKCAKISSIYNVFAFPMMLVLLFILPRLTDSLHPGNGGNPAFGKYDSNAQIKSILYPAFLGWTLIAVWIASMRYRIRLLEDSFTH